MAVMTHRVAFVTYGSHQHVVFDFQDELPNVDALMSSAPQHNTRTYTSKAMSFVHTELLTARHGYVSGADVRLVVVSDGISLESSRDIANTADELQQRGIEIFAIGLSGVGGSGVSSTDTGWHAFISAELELIASEPLLSHLFIPFLGVASDNWLNGTALAASAAIVESVQRQADGTTTITSFDIDMNTGQLAIAFSDGVYPRSFSVDTLSLLDTSGNIFSFTSESAILAVSDKLDTISDQVTIRLLGPQLRAIQSAVSVSMTASLAAASGLFIDAFGRPTAMISVNVPLAARVFTPNEPPIGEQFDVTGATHLTVRFSKTVILDTSMMFLQNRMSSPTAVVSLNNSVITTLSMTTLRIFLDPNILFNAAKSGEIGVLSSATFLRFEPGAAVDSVGGINIAQTLPVSEFRTLVQPEVATTSVTTQATETTVEELTSVDDTTVGSGSGIISGSGEDDDVLTTVPPQLPTELTTRGAECISGCPVEIEAVCGVDQVSYPSSCVALCMGIDLFFPGACNELPQSLAPSSQSSGTPSTSQPTATPSSSPASSAPTAAPITTSAPTATSSNRPTPSPTDAQTRSPVSSSTCVDNDAFMDQFGFRCQDWFNFECSWALDLGYSELQHSSLLEACPLSCRLCSVETNSPTVIPTASPLSSGPTPTPTTSSPAYMPTSQPTASTFQSTSSSSPVTTNDHTVPSEDSTQDRSGVITTNAASTTDAEEITMNNGSTIGTEVITTEEQSFTSEASSTVVSTATTLLETSSSNTDNDFSVTSILTTQGASITSSAPTASQTPFISTSTEGSTRPDNGTSPAYDSTATVSVPNPQSTVVVDSTIELTTTGPTTCVDLVKDWTDSDSDTCEDYRSNNWCTETGGYGSSWGIAPGVTFGTYAVNGLSADGVCCSCGGGTISSKNRTSLLISFDLLAGPTPVMPPMIRLVFSEMIIAGSFNTSHIVLHNSEQPSSETLRLSEEATVSPSIVSATDSLVITISSLDYTRLLQLREVGRSSSTTLLSIDADSLVSISGTSLMAVDGVPVRHLTLDLASNVLPTDLPERTEEFNLGTSATGSSRPILLSAGLNMSSGIVLLTFQTDVDPATLVIQRLYIQSSPFGEVNSHQFSGGTVVAASEWTAQVPDHSVLVQLSREDHDALLMNTEMASHMMSTFFFAGHGLIKNTDGQPSFRVHASQAVQASVYIKDRQSPTLTSFNLNMRSGTLTLSFSEPIALRTLILPRFYLQSASNATEQFVQLTTGSSSLLAPSVINIEMAVQDVVRLQQSGIASIANTAFLSMEPVAVTDIAGNGVVGIERAHAMQVTNITVSNGIPINFDFGGVNDEPDGSDGLSDINKAMIGMAVTFILLIILMVVFISPTCTPKKSFDPFMWEAEDNILVSAMGYDKADLEWDTHTCNADNNLAVGDMVQVIEPYFSSQDDELELQLDEILTVKRLASHIPGWVYAKNKRNQTGLVPETVLQKIEVIDQEGYLRSLGWHHGNTQDKSDFVQHLDIQMPREANANNAVLHLQHDQIEDVDVDAYRTHRLLEPNGLNYTESADA